MADPIENESESVLRDSLDPDVLAAEIERLRHDEKFQAALKRVLERDRKVLDRLAET